MNNISKVNTKSPGELSEELLEREQTLEEVRREELEKVDGSKPPIKEIISEKDWSRVSHLLAEYLPRDKQKDELMELEKQGLRLMVSTDQKRLRPGIGMKMGEALGLDIPQEDLLQLLTAIEGIHFYSKGIDDIQDNDEARNDLPTLHEHMSNFFDRSDRKKVDIDELGENLANNYFLAIKSRNYSLVSDIDEANLPEGVRIDNIRIEMEKAEDELSNGQNLDLSGEMIGYKGFKPDYLGGDKKVPEQLFQGNKGKTAELFALIGREIGMLSDNYEGNELEKWGYEAGQAFQIHDDVLDLKHGRNSDLEENNYVFPIYVAERYLHTHSNNKKNKLGEELSDILRNINPNEEELKRANHIITEETPAVEASRNQAKYLVESANEYLDRVEWEKEQEVEKIKFMTKKLGYRREK